MFSLGREPQVRALNYSKSPRGAADYRLRRKPQSSSPDICRRSAADGYFFGLESWGSRPRLSIFRRFAAPPFRQRRDKPPIRYPSGITRKSAT